MRINDSQSPALASQTAPASKAIIGYVFLFIAIVALWAIPVNRPVDLPNWHEFDDSAIAKNFVQEPSNLLYPRVDWRGIGTGFVESELPLYPWVVSKLYGLGGVDILYGRVVSLLATAGALVLFMFLARMLLPEPGALAAVLFFGANRITNLVSTALQPEAFMLFFYLAAVYAFLQWRANGKWTAYLLAVAATSLAILEKSPAAHVGIFFVLVLYWEEGWAFLKSPKNWCFGISSLTAPALWYAHAHRLWTTYGNSLGISNEDHWIGLDSLRSVKQWLGLFTIEGLFVFSAGGVLLALLAAQKRKSRSLTLIVMWCASVAIYYVITIRTTGAFWAAYYHVASIAPAALLCGYGAACVMNVTSRFRVLATGAAFSLAALCLVWLGLNRLRDRGGAVNAFTYVTKALTRANFNAAETALLCVVCFGVVFLLWRLRSNQAASPLPSVFLFICGAGISSSLFISGHLIASDIAAYQTPTQELLCATHFRQFIPERALILASGGICGDALGHKSAFDAPEMFYWLDRKGFSLCTDQQTIPNVISIAKQGARYFAAEKTALETQPGFEAELKAHFKLIDSCDAASLFDLQQTPLR